jgi:HAD superfamily phosphatase (TIGR01668 family)
MRLLRANEVAASVFDVNYERLWSRGLRVLLFDLDNTLGRRGSNSLGVEALRLLDRLQARGFRLGILTNRKRGAADAVVTALRGRYAVLDVARKPSRKGFGAALARLGATPSTSAMIGDRRLTDILGANRSGIYSIRVRGFRH